MECEVIVMDSERIGNLIKKLREERHLTQREFADEFGVSYQAVSKWERGLNIPDIAILREICKKYQLSLDEILNGNVKENRKFPWWILGIILILVIFLLCLFLFRPSSYQFKTLSSTCSAFKVTGSLAYDQKKSSIYISNIDYCGGDDENVYESIHCSLYEKNSSGSVKISQCESKSHITLEEYLKTVEIENSHYSSNCKNYHDDSLYLEIEAINKDYKTTIYTIPLSLNHSCTS